MIRRRSAHWLILGCLGVGCAAGGDFDDSVARDASNILDGWDDVAEGAPADGGEVAVDSSEEDSGSDSTEMDSSAVDSSAVDSGPIDSSPIDSSPIDSSPIDSSPIDSSPIDSSPTDSAVLDSGKADTGPFDTGPLDTGAPDTGPFDTGTPDTGPFDTGSPADTYVDPCAVSLAYDFEGGDQGFVHAPLSTYASDDPWARGTPSGTIKCHGGTGKCFTTGLTGNYTNCQTATLSTPVLDVSKCAGSPKKVIFSFWHYYDFEAISAGHYWDGGVLQVSTDGTTWTDVVTSQAYDGALKGDFSGCTPVPLINNKPGWSATIAGGAWKQVTYEVPAAQRVANLRFRFLFGSDAATAKRGWYVDDVTVTTSP